MVATLTRRWRNGSGTIRHVLCSKQHLRLPCCSSPSSLLMQPLSSCYSTFATGTSWSGSRNSFYPVPSPEVVEAECAAMARLKSLPSIAVIGTGRMGQLRMQGIKANSNCKLAYVVDNNAEAAAHFGIRWGTQFSTDFEAVVADPGLDAVWISTPTPTHMDLILTALKAKKAVVVEKPVAGTPEEINKCYDAAEEAGAPLICSFQRRFDPSYVALREAVVRGDVGQLQSAHCVFRDHPLPPLEFLKLGGNIFHDLVCHDCDYISWVVGEQPVGVVAYGSSHIEELKDLNIFDAATVALLYPSGLICTMDLNRGCAYAPSRTTYA
eukprot:COSAG05_NODE_739_length_7625_cov_31.047429_4_plen_324_part_00